MARWRGLPLEVGMVASIRSAFERVRAEFGRIDVLVNNVVTVIKPSVDVTEADWDGVVDLPEDCSSAARSRAHDAGAGWRQDRQYCFVAFVTLPGQLPMPRRRAWCTSRAFSRRVGAGHVNVNAVAPISRAETGTSADPVFREFILEHIPPGRMAEQRDLAGAALFLASPASDFVTGHTLVVDGGWLTL